MVACSQCLTPNSLDSHFCKSCGAVLAAEDLSIAQQKVHDLVAEGYRIFNEGRTEEARLIAETALADEPSSSSALSLRGMCHERAGELALALECFEKVVGMNPDSPLDKIKVTHLRQAITGKSLSTEVPHRRGTALATAAAAVVFVVAVGIAIATSGNTNEPVASKTDTAVKSAFDTAAFSSKDLTVPQQQPANNQVDPNKAVEQPNTTTPPALNTNTNTAQQSNRTSPSWMSPLGNGSNRGTVLPDVGNGGLQGNIGVRPVQPNITITPNAPVTGSKDPDPVMGSNPGTPIGPNANGQRSEDDPGIIEINVSKPKQTLGGSQVVDGNGADALLKTANQQFLLGRYSQAAGTFEAALRAGAPSGSTNQRLGQCFANIGNKSEAIGAYRRAISAYEAAIARGGDTSRLQSALESCKQALKVLGG